MGINFRLVLSLIGYMIVAIGLLMLLPAFVDLFTNGKGTYSFFMFSLMLSFLGLLLAFSNKQEQVKGLGTKDGLLLAFLSWVIIVGVAALPFTFSYLRMSYTDAYFEVMSGLTTTGATVITNLDNLSYGFHLWRVLVEWIGGIGIIITAVILIPSFQGAGLQLFKAEAFEMFDNAIDKAKKIATGMLLIYTMITILIIGLLLFVAKLNLFDSIIHALTSVSTSGFSNKTESMAYFNNPTAEIILIIAMISGALPYVLFYNLVFLKKTSIFKDRQVIGFLRIILWFIIILTAWLVFVNGYNLLLALRYISFSVVSVITGTGLINFDFSVVGYFPAMLFACIMFVGGCGGSTACGIKVYRFQIAYATTVAALNKLFLRQHISVPYYNGKFIDNETGSTVLIYFFLFGVTLFIGAVFLSACNLDFTTALSASITCLTNVGPGLGPVIGPTGTFASLSDTAKWISIALMLLGRLEIFGVIILFNRNFWTT